MGVLNHNTKAICDVKLLKMKSLAHLQLRQLDGSLEKWRVSHLPPRPKSGWLKAIRTTLGMTSLALARRLQLSDSAIRKLEQSEAEGAITLASLRRVAEALDCELHYALVPRKPLKLILSERAMHVARERVAAVAHHMALESQTVDEAITQSQIEELAEELLRKPRVLW
ncbi:MAG: mobile mystery protein A [Betaproteobacteria bacterium]